MERGMHSLRASRRVDKQGAQKHTGLYYGWLVVGASFVIVLLNTGVQSSFGNFLKPMSATFGWDRATVSIPAALATLLSGLFQPFVGRLVDRVGARRVITGSLLLMALSTAALAATPGIWYLTGVYGILCALGFSGAGTVPSTTLVAHWFVRQRGRAMGLVNAGGSVGQLLIIPASMALLLWTDWRTTYLILGGLLLLVGVPIALLLLRSKPQDMGLLPDGDTVLVEGEPGPTQQPRASAQAPLEPVHWRGALTSSPMWLLMSGFFVCGFTLATISTHFVAFATDRGISPASAATALGLIGAFNIIGTLLVGSLSDRLGRKNPLALIYLVRSVAFVVLLTVEAPWALYLFAALVGLAWFSTVPPTVSLTAEIYGARHMGTLGGLIFASHQIGGALSIYCAGRLFDLSGSYTAIYVVDIALLLAAGVVSYAIQERRYSLKYMASAPA
jgi:MFS family permease